MEYNRCLELITSAQYKIYQYLVGCLETGQFPYPAEFPKPDPERTALQETLGKISPQATIVKQKNTDTCQPALKEALMKAGPEAVIISRHSGYIGLYLPEFMRETMRSEFDKFELNMWIGQPSNERSDLKDILTAEELTAVQHALKSGYQLPNKQPEPSVSITVAGKTFNFSSIEKLTQELHNLEPLSPSDTDIIMEKARQLLIDRNSYIYDELDLGSLEPGQKNDINPLKQLILRYCEEKTPGSTAEIIDCYVQITRGRVLTKTDAVYKSATTIHQL